MLHGSYVPVAGFDLIHRNSYNQIVISAVLVILKTTDLENWEWGSMLVLFLLILV